MLLAAPQLRLDLAVIDRDFGSARVTVGKASVIYTDQIESTRVFANRRRYHGSRNGATNRDNTSQPPLLAGRVHLTPQRPQARSNRAFVQTQH